MAPRKHPWFRLYVEMIWDRKIRRLNVIHRWLWVVSLACARSSPQPGLLLLTEGAAMGLDDFADAAAIPVRQVRTGLEALRSLDLLGQTDDGIWFVPRWNERQFESDDVTIRTAKHRSMERSKGRSKNAPDTDTEETDTEKIGPTSVGANEILKQVLEPGTAYPERFRGHLGREVKSLLTEGFPPERVTLAAQSCVTKGLSPSTLPSLMVQVGTVPPRVDYPEL